MKFHGSCQINLRLRENVNFKVTPCHNQKRGTTLAYVGGDPLEMIHFTQKPKEFKPYVKWLDINARAVLLYETAKKVPTKKMVCGIGEV